MTRFQDLLKPDAASTPRLDQERASRQLPEAVKASRLFWWTKAHAIPTESSFLLIIVAPYSHYDLAMLDILDDMIANPWVSNHSRIGPIYVANLLDYQSLDQLTKEIPIITRAPLQTPVAAVWIDEEWRNTESGKRGRDLVAAEFGISPEAFNERVIARVPKYHPTASG